MRVMVNGSNGKMGSESVKAINHDTDLTLVASTDMKDDFEAVIKDKKPEAVLDFTHPSCVYKNVKTILTNGANAVIGTTGLSDEQVKELESLARIHGKSLLIIPNFAIGAVLMMKFSAEAAKYMERVEIIEFHHDKKADAPSGTAIKTADLIVETAGEVNKTVLKEEELIEGARGGNRQNIPIHSVRMPGFVASQEVILGGLGQTLTIRHDSIHRESFMPGVVLALKKSKDVKGLVYGLEKILD